MKQINACLAGLTMVCFTVVLSQGCTKSADTDEELIGNWKKTDDFEGYPRGEAVNFTIGEYVYVATGSSYNERYKDLWEYNTSLRYWTQKADLPGAARNSAVAFSLGTRGYIGTGYDGSSRLKDFWEYDQLSNTWSQKADFAGTGRYDAVAFAVNGKGYISCGFDGKNLKDLWEFTPGLTPSDPGSWEQKASVGGSKRTAAVAFVFNGKAYICSGDNNGEIQKDLWMYDPSENQWTEKNKIYDYNTDDTFDDDYGAIPRQNAVAFVLGNFVYLTTGINGSLLSSTWRYDPVADRWIEKTGFEGTARQGALAFTLSNRAFVLTGMNGSLVMDNMYEFLPDEEQVDND